MDRDRVESVVREVLESSQEHSVTSVPPSPGVIALGSDHGGFALKEVLKRYLTEELGLRVKDVGTTDETACD